MNWVNVICGAETDRTRIVQSFYMGSSPLSIYYYITRYPYRFVNALIRVLFPIFRILDLPFCFDEFKSQFSGQNHLIAMR